MAIRNPIISPHRPTSDIIKKEDIGGWETSSQFPGDKLIRIKKGNNKDGILVYKSGRVLLPVDATYKGKEEQFPSFEDAFRYAEQLYLLAWE